MASQGATILPESRVLLWTYGADCKAVRKTNMYKE